MKNIKEMTTKEQVKVFLNALFGGLVAGCVGWFIGGFGWSYELQGYIFDHIAAFNCALTFGLAVFLALITSAIFPEKEQEDEYIPGFFDRKKDGEK